MEFHSILIGFNGMLIRLQLILNGILTRIQLIFNGISI